MPLLATSTAEYVVVEAVLPGQAPESIGVLLFDPSTGRFEGRWRRDWAEFAADEESEVLSLLPDDLERKARDMGGDALLEYLETNLSNTVRITDRQTVLSANFERTLRDLYRKHVEAKVLPFRTHLPVYSCRAAAGHWGEQRQVEAEPEDWIEAPADLRLTPDMFVAQVVGRSMEPLIPDGSFCVFRGKVTGSREGRRVLIEDRRQPEGGERYTVKVYRSVKTRESDGGSWRHASIRLEPLNPEYEAWDLDPEDSSFAVIGEFVRVLD